MAKTSFATGNALTRKAYDEKLFRDMVKESYFSKFMGMDSSSVVHVKEELQKNKGDVVNFGLRMRLSGNGVTSGQILQGNEESLTFHSDSVTLEQYRHAVRDDGAMSRQRTAFDISSEAKQALLDWGSEKLDSLCFDALLDQNQTKVFYLDSSGDFQGTTAFSTAKAALHATNSKITLDFISAVKAWAKTGGARSYVPIRPVKMEGKEYFIMLVHPDCMYDLKASSAWQQAQREAQVRGEKNPLFTGAAGVYDGVVKQESNYVH